jgi:hypothetical protein
MKKIKETKAKIIEKNKTPLRVVKYSFYFFISTLALLGIATIYDFIVGHEWRSPIILQSPYYKEDIKSPLVEATQSARIVGYTFAEEKEQEEAVLYATDSVQDRIARATVKEFGEEYVDDILDLVFKESSFNHLAQNPTSSAYGLFQFLDQTWGIYDCQKTDVIDEQIRCGIKYIKARYGNPARAMDFWRINKWY